MANQIPPPSGIDPLFIRDIFAVLLLVLGAIGLVTAAAAADWRAGLAVGSVIAMIAGGYLGYQR